MKVIIWGAGKGCEKALVVCKRLNWEIVAIIDSDTQKAGMYIENVIVQNISILKYIDRDTYIVIANSCAEVFDMAQKYTNLIISWDILSILYRGSIQNPDYETLDLQDKNIENCKLLKNRDTLLTELMKNYDKEVIFAEVGVAFGDFSKKILEMCNPSILYLIDAWEGDRYGGGLEIVENYFQEEIKNGTVIIKKGFSNIVLEEFSDSSIDIVYIDTAHSYEITWEELCICRSKVKKDGFICGHDYTKYNSYSRMDYGVYDAVNRFCVEYDYEMCYLTMERDGLHSFALKKICR